MWDILTNEGIIALFTGDNYVGILLFILLTVIVYGFTAKMKKEKESNSILSQLNGTIKEMNSTNNEITLKLMDSIDDLKDKVSSNDASTQKIISNIQIMINELSKNNDAKYSSIITQLMELLNTTNSHTNKLSELHTYCMAKNGRNEQ